MRALPDLTSLSISRNPVLPPRPRYVLGLDLGQAHDFTALAVAELTRRDDGPTVPHLQRFPLGTPYPVIVHEVMAMVAELADGAEVTLGIDKTGVGTPVYDLFAAALRALSLPRQGPRPRLYGVVIHGGERVSVDRGVFHVPKRDLAGIVQATLQQRRLAIAADLPEAPVLKVELASFKVRISLTTGHDSYGAAEGWRERTHDDLVLAVAIALWIAERLPEGPGMAWV